MQSGGDPISNVSEVYKQHFGQYPISVVRAPGRLNLIGEHTDYNLGLVLPGAIDWYLYLAFGSSDKKTTIYSVNKKELLSFEKKRPNIGTQANWQDYILAVWAVCEAHEMVLKPCSIAFYGNIPLGAGLSSSAALCCGLIMGLCEQNGHDISRAEIAKLAQKAEHLVGLDCGLMDQYAVLYSQKDNLLYLDCNDLSYHLVRADLNDYRLLLINSNVKHALAAGSAYNDRRRACEFVVSVAQRLDPKIQSLRDVSSDLLESIKSQLKKEYYKQASFVLLENERVDQTVIALENGNVAGVGELLIQGHLGLKNEYAVTVPETDILVDICMDNGFAGARQMGGGFGGCIIGLLKKDLDVVQQVCQAYQTNTGLEAIPISAQLSDGASLYPI